MQTLEGLKRTIGSTRDLQSLVKTMKAMAAVNIRQYEKALAIPEKLRQDHKMGFRADLQQPAGGSVHPGVLRWGPPGSGGLRFRSGDVRVIERADCLICSANHDGSDRDPLSTVLMAVGERVPGLLEDSGHPVETVMSLPASVAGITARSRISCLRSTTGMKRRASVR
jgi:F-type H+-transporting ATPase subunit gamma